MKGTPKTVNPMAKVESAQLQRCSGSQKIVENTRHPSDKVLLARHQQPKHVFFVFFSTLSGFLCGFILITPGCKLDSCFFFVWSNVLFFSRLCQTLLIWAVKKWDGTLGRWTRRLSFDGQVCAGADRESTQWHYHHFSLQVQAYPTRPTNRTNLISMDVLGPRNPWGFRFLSFPRCFFLRKAPKKDDGTKKNKGKQVHKKWGVFKKESISPGLSIEVFFRSQQLLDLISGDRRNRLKTLDLSIDDAPVITAFAKPLGFQWVRPIFWCMLPES